MKQINLLKRVHRHLACSEIVVHDGRKNLKPQKVEVHHLDAKRINMLQDAMMQDVAQEVLLVKGEINKFKAKAGWTFKWNGKVYKFISVGDTANNSVARRMYAISKT